MGQATGRETRLAFSFRFDRRGQTTSWALGRIENHGATGGEVPGAIRDTRDDRWEWYRAVVDLDPDEDRAGARSRAEQLAEAEFLRRHPGHHVAG